TSAGASASQLQPLVILPPLPARTFAWASLMPPWLRPRSVCHMDDEVDNYTKEIIAELIHGMRDEPRLIEPALSLFSATRHDCRPCDQHCRANHLSSLMARLFTIVRVPYRRDDRCSGSTGPESATRQSAMEDKEEAPAGHHLR